MNRSKLLIYALFSLFAVLLVYCNVSTREAQPVADYLNLSDTVDYVGMSTCIGCHQNVYETYRKTGMGRSFDHATLEKTDATFGKHALVYDARSDFYYKPFFKGDTLFVKEFRLDGTDTIHQRTEAISYIVGSGHHTNSHILDFNGYIYQAPITFYTQDQKWDMAPGFETENLRFSRLLTSECLTCHNHFPKMAEGSINKFTEVPRGIACERCHGPGELHVREKMAGQIVDTSQYIDYSIVNPRDLERDRQMDLCQRCHLQGIAVLEEGKSFYDFKPSMKLSDVLNVFLPRFTDSHEKFIMASQADRLQMSACYQSSEKLTCLSCHNPHHTVKETPREKFNNTCRSCHGEKVPEVCSGLAESQQMDATQCVGCHMPPSSSIDIPHVNITDHYISRQTARRALQMDPSTQEEITRFLGLQMMTKSDPTPLDMARGYIATHDKYVEASQMLDSALFYLTKASPSEPGFFKTQIHYYFTRKDFAAVRQLAKTEEISSLTDGWTLYRIGEAFATSSSHDLALPYLQKAVQDMPYHLEFQEKLGNSYVGLQQLDKAEETYRFVLSENAKRKAALCNLGYVRALKRQFQEAMELYDKAIALDPDYVQALLNKAAMLQFLNRQAEARKLAKRILRIEPENARAQLLLQSVDT
ncbi:MAG: tetratricopeptide repeat protein [Bacteroidota bacterium]